MNYTIGKNDFSVHSIPEIVAVLTAAFQRNPVIGEYFFDGDCKKIAVFMQLIAEYYARFGTIFTCTNPENRLVAVSLWSEPGSRHISPGNVIKGGFLFPFIKGIWQTGFKSLCRILEYQRIIDKYRIKEPHCYLGLLGSIEKGAGRILLQHNIDLYKEHTLYWESSVSKDNHAYYKSFGATMYQEITVKEISMAFFMRKPV